MSVSVGPVRFECDADANRFIDWAQDYYGEDVRTLDGAAIQESFDEYAENHNLDGDPTPYCTGCGAMRAAQCGCGPIADNN